MASQTKVIKLYTSESIHRVKENPTTFTGLQDLLFTLFGQGQFPVSYKNQEGNFISITNDLELTKAYESSSSIMKLYIGNLRNTTTEQMQGFNNLQVSESQESQYYNICQENNETVGQQNQQQEDYEEFQIFERDQLEYQMEEFEDIMVNEEQLDFQQVEQYHNPESRTQQEELQTQNEQQNDKKQQQKDKKLQQLENLKSQKKDLKSTIKELKAKINKTEKQNKHLKSEQQKEKKKLEKQIKKQLKQNQPTTQDQGTEKIKQEEECWNQEQQQFNENEQSAQFHPGMFRGMRCGQRGRMFRGGRQGHHAHPFFGGNGPHPKFLEKHKILIEQHIRPEFDRVTNIILQELKNSQLQGCYESDTDLIVHERVRCNGCQVFPMIGVRYKCSVCKDFDFCMKCESEISHPHAFLKIKNLSQEPKQIFVVIDEEKEQQMKNQEKVHRKPILKAQIVDHLSFPNNSSVQPGQSILKTWQVRNIGTAPWPQNTSLFLIKGNLNPEQCQIPALQPGEEGAIQMNLLIPNLDGHFVGHYKFMTPQGEQFGKKLIVKVNARENAYKKQAKKNRANTQESKKQEKVPEIEEHKENALEQQSEQQVQENVEQQVPEQPAQKSELDEQIESVMQLGFEDRSAIMSLIVAYDGNLDKVVETLLMNQ